MAKAKAEKVHQMLNRFAVERLVRNAQQLHDAGFLTDQELRRVIHNIDAERQPGFSSGADIVENAVVELDESAKIA